MDNQLIDDAWAMLTRLSEADATCRHYTWWARLCLEKDRSVITVNETVFRAALRDVLGDHGIIDLLHLLSLMACKAEARQHRTATLANPNVDLEERTADW